MQKPTRQLSQLRAHIRLVRHPAKAEASARFFKTGKGCYGYGDVFYGLTVPQCRTMVKQYMSLPLNDVAVLLSSKVHEERLIGLLLLVNSYEKSDEKRQEMVYHFYLRHLERVNNWDLVDLSAPKIVGAHLGERKRQVLYRLVRSRSLWERRIAIVATHYFIIHRREYHDTFALAELLLRDTEDLIHKAAGWMLREVGKYCTEQVLMDWLDMHAAHMPRTMLRYAIERLPKKVQLAYRMKKE